MKPSEFKIFQYVWKLTWYCKSSTVRDPSLSPCQSLSKSTTWGWRREMQINIDIQSLPKILIFIITFLVLGTLVHSFYCRWAFGFSIQRIQSWISFNNYQEETKEKNSLKALLLPEKLWGQCLGVPDMAINLG